MSGGSFNGHILVDKLSKLNNSQQSIETLSHWCIFHMNKAKQVVETWDRQFYCSPRDQRVSFLYLANDILQNSRRKGLEFVGEFLKVLPNALNDVIENGDEFGKNAALRLVDIWEERKVFGSRGQILKEELLGRNGNNTNRHVKAVSYKLKQPSGDMLNKLISCYEHVYDGPIDEDALYGKCQEAIGFFEKLERESDFNICKIGSSEVAEEWQGKHAMLKECIEQLKAAETSRSTLVSQLKAALREQEHKVDQVTKQREVAKSRYNQVGDICQQLVNRNSGKLLHELVLRDSPQSLSVPPSSFAVEAPSSSGDKEHLSPVSTHEGHLAGAVHTEEEHRRNAAAAVAAKLTASTSSAQVLSFVLSSLASEGVMGQSVKEDYPSDSKRIRLNDDMPSYSAADIQYPPPPPFPHPDSLYLPPPPSSPMTIPSPTMQYLPAPSSPMTIPSPTMQYLPPPSSPVTIPSPTMRYLPPPPPPDSFPPSMQLPPPPPPPPLPDNMFPSMPPIPPPTAYFSQAAGSMTPPMQQPPPPPPDMFPSMTGIPYMYSSVAPPPPFPSYSIGTPGPYPNPPNPPNPYYSFLGGDGGGFFGQPPLPTASPPISRQ